MLLLEVLNLDTNFFENGKSLLDGETFRKEYGCVKIEYREHENGLYYVYGFRNNLLEWDFDKGELVYITSNAKSIEDIKNNILSFRVGDSVCKGCFAKKNIESISDQNSGYWAHYFWKHTPKVAREDIQQEILFKFPEIDWSMACYITEFEDGPVIPYGFWCKYCMTKDEFATNAMIKKYSLEFEMIWKKEIAYELMEGNEKLLEQYLCDFIENIEEGMVFKENQYKVEGGVIDILAEDKDGITCIIELKTTENDKNILWQSAYYPTCFDEKVRMITIAPNYSSRIYNALKNVNTVETKVYGKDANGYIEIKDFKIDTPPEKLLVIKNEQGIEDAV